MGIEIVVMGFAVASAFFGLLGPVVIWATWTSVANRRIVRELEAAEGIDHVLGVEGADASTPARLSLSIQSRQTQLDAVVRGGMKLWHVRLARTSKGAEYALVDDSWTSVAKAARALAPLASDDESGPRHVAGAFSMFVDDNAQTAAIGDVERPYVATLLEAQARSNNRLLQVVSTESEIFFEVTRVGLKSNEALPLLRRCARLVDALEGPNVSAPTTSANIKCAERLESGNHRKRHAGRRPFTGPAPSLLASRLRVRFCAGSWAGVCARGRASYSGSAGDSGDSSLASSSFA